MDQKIVLLFVFFFAVINAEVGLNVTIFYNAFSPESAKFITEQVYPALKGDLNGHVLIDWIPSGRTKFINRDEGIHIICEHGPDECYENKLHACAIERIIWAGLVPHESRGLTLLKFINCMMKNNSKSAYKLGPCNECPLCHGTMIWEGIRDCVNNTEGETLLRYYGGITKDFQNPLIHEPTVVFNDEYNMELNVMAQKDFLAVACKQFTNASLHFCDKYNSAISIAASPLLGFLVYALAKVFI